MDKRRAIDGVDAAIADGKKRCLPQPDCCVGIISLPDMLPSIGDYLSFPSRAIAAVAFTAPSSSYRKHTSLSSLSINTTSKAILGSLNNNDVLDFAGLEKDLASKLNDDDIRAMLICIDAKSSLKVIKLAGCKNITGSGLEPLFGSMVLRHIDLNLVGRFESPRGVERDVNISEDVTIPILQSIVDSGGNSFRYVEYPYKFKFANELASDALQQFDNNFEQYLYGLSLTCQVSSCRRVIGPDYSICYDCSRLICKECFEEGVSREEVWCSKCERESCGCIGVKTSNCETQSCPSHEDLFCTGCVEEVNCRKCGYRACTECNTVQTCDACREGICSGCNRNNIDSIDTCTTCKRKLCSHCSEMTCCGNDYSGKMCNDCSRQNYYGEMESSSSDSDESSDG